MVRSPAYHSGAQQPGPQHGDLGDAGLRGNPEYEASQFVPDFPYARYAELLGLRGIKVDTPDAVGAAWDQALAADWPVVYEAVTDPDVPPLPPHLTLDQARQFTAMLLKGDVDRAGIIRQTVRELVGTLRGRSAS